MSSGIDYFVKPDNMWSMYNEKEDAVPKYKLTTSLNMTKIYNDGNKDCIDFCNHFAQLIYSLRPSFLGDNLSKTALIEWAEQDPVRIKYMFDKVYIALNEPEVFYKRGDRFRHKRDGDECVIIQISAGNAQLLHIDSFNYWSGTANVKNIDKITQAEFAQIAGSCGPEGWEKI